MFTLPFLLFFSLYSFFFYLFQDMSGHTSIILNRIFKLSVEVYNLINENNLSNLPFNTSKTFNTNPNNSNNSNMNQEARDLSLQSLTLIELLLSFNLSSSLFNKLEICYQAYENIIKYLLEERHSNTMIQINSCHLLNSNQSYQMISNEVKCDEVNNCIQKVEEINSNCLELNQNFISFSQIIGCEEAKQILYENIVLPLSLPLNIRSELFQGVRSSGGNVLLFGPPGTGNSTPY